LVTAPAAKVGTLAAAGFRDITVERVPSPLRMTSAADCFRFEHETFGALHQMLEGTSEADREAAWEEVSQALSEFDRPDGFAAPCETLVISGTR
jgi:hypothetical protein